MPCVWQQARKEKGGGGGNAAVHLHVVSSVPPTALCDISTRGWVGVAKAQRPKGLWPAARCRGDAGRLRHASHLGGDHKQGAIYYMRCAAVLCCSRLSAIHRAPRRVRRMWQVPKCVCCYVRTQYSVLGSTM
jgi:hypothetical protein